MPKPRTRLIERNRIFLRQFVQAGFMSRAIVAEVLVRAYEHAGDTAANVRTRVKV